MHSLLDITNLEQKGVKSAPDLLKKLIDGTIDVICSNPGDKAECAKSATPINGAVENLTKVIHSTAKTFRSSSDN